ncbi:MAG: hypothetical protein LBL90_06275 [Prevotellaceae bacterium]|jgi:uncharacterized membrane-anchored protein YhcB (DUF1043 family)|nr:hypothetical protein [Prevotellaceae bacterium]
MGHRWHRGQTHHQPKYYRELFIPKDELQEYMEVLQEEKADINDSQNILDWFKQKYQELKQVARPYTRLAVKLKVNIR